MTPGDALRQGGPPGAYRLRLEQRQQLQQLRNQRQQVLQQMQQVGQQQMQLVGQQMQLMQNQDAAQMPPMAQALQLWQQAQLLTQQRNQLNLQIQQLQLQMTLVPPAASVHTAAAVLVPALRHLPNLHSCALVGEPVDEGILQLLPSTLEGLLITQRAFRGPVNLAAATRLVELDLPDLQPRDTLPPPLRKLVLQGRRQARFDMQPILPLTRLQSFELLGCVPSSMEALRLTWARGNILMLHIDTAGGPSLLPSVLWQPNLLVSHHAKER